MGCRLPGFSVHGDAPGKNTGMDCHALHQQIFPTQGSNSGLPHCRRILYQLSHQGGPIVRVAELKRRLNSRPIAECRLKSGPCRGKDETPRSRMMGISGWILCKLWADRLPQYPGPTEVVCLTLLEYSGFCSLKTMEKLHLRKMPSKMRVSLLKISLFDPEPQITAFLAYLNPYFLKYWKEVMFLTLLQGRRKKKISHNPF